MLFYLKENSGFYVIISDRSVRLYILTIMIGGGKLDEEKIDFMFACECYGVFGDFARGVFC